MYRRTRALFISLGRDWERPEQMDETTQDTCCENRPPGMPPEEYQALIQAARDFFGEEASARDFVGSAGSRGASAMEKARVAARKKGRDRACDPAL